MFISASRDLPSLQALRASDERLLAEELRILATRQQLAVVRTLADELERNLVRGLGPLAVQAQLVEELARLGCRSLETAAALAEKSGDAEESGMHRALGCVGS